MTAWTVVAALLMAATPACAHNVVPGIGGFSGGLLHPVLVPAHVLALTGLALLIGQQSPRRRAWLFATLAFALAAGIAVIVSAFAVTDADGAVLGVAAAAGIAVAVARPSSVLVSLPLIAVAGAAIELDSVPEEISMRATFLALIGTAIGVLLVVALLAELTVRLRRDWQRVGVRIVGSWVAASAILVLALRLAR